LSRQVLIGVGETAQTLSTAIAVGLVGLCCACTAHAGIVLGPGGHLPFGGASAWEVEGQNYSRMDGWSPPWGSNGNASSAPWNYTVPNSTTSFQMFNKVGTTGNVSGPVKLSAATIINASDLGPGVNRVRGWSTAVLNDRVRVTGTGFAGGRIQLEWEVDGRLAFELNSVSGAPLGAPQGIFWAHMAGAQIFAAWQEPGQVVMVEQSIAQISGVRKGSNLTTRQTGALKFLDEQQTLSGFHQFPDGKPHWIDDKPFPKTGVITSGVPMLPGELVPVMLGLGTFTNALWDLLDFGMLESGVGANFASTAELKAVRLFNMDGSPYTQPWQLYSENGYDYPEVYGTIPEPGSLLLLGLGLAGMGLVRRRP
jgi:hypothetical protein